MARLSLPPMDTMTPDQRAACAEVVAGRRGKLPTPMIAWLRNPELARRAQSLGELLRFGTSLDDRLVELAILVCSRHWMAHQVWTSHVRYARKAGLDEATIAAIAKREIPKFASDRETAVFEVARSLLEVGRLRPEAYAAALERLGEAALVELVAVVGYYCLVGLTANAFELGLPQNLALELADPDWPVPAP